MQGSVLNTRKSSSSTLSFWEERVDKAAELYVVVVSPCDYFFCDPLFSPPEKTNSKDSLELLYELPSSKKFRDFCYVLSSGRSYVFGLSTSAPFLSTCVFSKK